MKPALLLVLAPLCLGGPIDREALVARHSVTLDHPDKTAPLSVGNGNFAFTADITGLQGLEDFHADGGVPLGTLSQWGWHSFPNPEGYTRAEVDVPYPSHGRMIPYLEPSDNTPRRDRAAAWLRANPHRIDLGRLRFVIRSRDGTWRPLALSDLTKTSQSLDLWTGRIESGFSCGGHSVKVSTVVHPDEDAVAIRVESPWVGESQALGVELAFSPPTDDWRGAPDPTRPAHDTANFVTGPRHIIITRMLDATSYVAGLAWQGDARISASTPRSHILQAAPGAASLEAVLRFSPAPDAKPVPGYASTRAAAAAYWKDFWSRGGAIDLSGSKDSRWFELERRIVLSQYLTAIQCSGDLPPQETGLTFNSWYGKFHLEMHPLHAAHFALWSRPELLARSMDYYGHILPKARANAARQGFSGARWPKMTDPAGDDSPSGIGVFLVWQQPHPIFMAELLYRANPCLETLHRYESVVRETAIFMAAYPEWDETSKCYNLGPVLIPAQESYGKYRTSLRNPTYELAYWHWALKTAELWRERLGQPREPLWDRVADQLARPAPRDGHYPAIATEPYLLRNDHPSLLMAYGWCPPTPLIDPPVMGRTLDDVLSSWNWKSTWGWDCPVVAMTAARLGRPAEAVNTLLRESPKNVWLPNGHNWQDKRLPIYLPGNGSLLYAAAMMAAGWDGAPPVHAPGFPSDGTWTVRCENIRPAP